MLWYNGGWIKEVTVKTRAQFVAAMSVCCLATVVQSGQAMTIGEMDLVDISDEVGRQSVVAAGTQTVYNGHPTTILEPDDKTMFCFWPLGHGGSGGPAAMSTDAGRTWMRIDDRMPSEMRYFHECPMAHGLEGPDKKRRLWVWSGFKTKAPDDPVKPMPSVMSEDGGKTWREMPPMEWKFRCVLSFQAMIRLKDGAYLGIYHRSPNGCSDGKQLELLSSVTRDGGFTWSDPKVIAKKDGYDFCEPWLVRSPRGDELAVLIRENARKHPSQVIFSKDEGETWTEPVDAPLGLTGDRHQGVMMKDGRMVVCFRDQEPGSPTRSHYVAWIGPYDALHGKRLDQAYRVKLLHSYAGWDCGYSGVHRLKDGTIVCTTYLKYRPDNNRHSVVTTRFKVPETDARRKLGRPFVWGRIENCGIYAGLHPRLRSAFSFLRRPDLATLPVGRYEIEKDRVWAMVQELELTPFGDMQHPEVHRAFIDIQAPIDGPETYGLYDCTADGFEPFDTKKDIAFAERRTKPLTLEPGEFAIFFPGNGAHAPCKTLGAAVKRKKLVIKIRK